MGSHISCAAILASNVYGYPCKNSDGVTMRDPSLLLVGAASPIPFERMLEHAAFVQMIDLFKNAYHFFCGSIASPS